MNCVLVVVQVRGEGEVVNKSAECGVKGELGSPKSEKTKEETETFRDRGTKLGLSGSLET